MNEIDVAGLSTEELIALMHEVADEVEARMRYRGMGEEAEEGTAGLPF